MFFNRSQFTHAPNLAPHVLALSSDTELCEIRIRPFLAALLARGAIAGFQFADRKLNSTGWHKDFSFTHIWCHRNVSTAQYRFLQKHADAPIIYDIDDLMTSAPDFVKSRPRVTERIHWCLNRAKIVTTSTEVLRSHLLNKVSSQDAVIILKNGHIGYSHPRRPQLQKKIIWTSGDHPFVTHSDPQFVNQLAEIVNRHNYEMVAIGRFDPTVGQLFNQWRHIRRMDFNSYRELMRFFAGAIGLAPLPSELSTYNQQFFNAKSDIKLLDYLSSGLVPVCTSAPPYENSELYISELAAKGPRELLKKLEACILDHARWIERIDHDIHESDVLNQRLFNNLSRSLDFIFKI